MTVTIQMVWTDEADQSLGLPQYETTGAAGADLRANLPDLGEMTFAPMSRQLVPTGLRMAIPAGYEVQIRARSSMAKKFGMGLPNAPGTIDSDYRGPVGVLMINLGADPYTIQHGDRIAQMIVAPVVQAGFSEVSELPDTDRGTGGFGSTGKR